MHDKMDYVKLTQTMGLHFKLKQRKKKRLYGGNIHTHSSNPACYILFCFCYQQKISQI